MEAPGILLVEDHGATREAVSRVLRAEGFEVHVARDGARALALMSTQRPQLVLQDLVLPDIDGFALARKLRSLAGDAPLRMVAFSGLVSNLDAQRIREHGFDAVIAKPVLPTQLVELVRAEWSAAERESSDVREVESDASDPTFSSEGEFLRRTSGLAAELTLQRALTQAMLDDGDAEGALVSALGTCVAVGENAFGALYLCEGEALRARTFGSESEHDLGALADFFGQLRWLRGVIRSGRSRTLQQVEPQVCAALARAGARAALIAPLVHAGQQLGALFVAHSGDDSHFCRFAAELSEQLARALALGQAHRRRARAEREAEQQRVLARDQAAMWRALVDNAPDVVMHLDASGRVRFINRAPATPHRSGEASWFDLVDEGHHEEMRAALRSVFASGTSHTLELGSAGPHEPSCWTENHLGPIRSGSTVSGALVIQRDISDKKAREAELYMTDRIASVANLAAAIAHEVNNPLASVLANLELALREAEQQRVSPELCAELSDAREAASRVHAVVNDLNVFSRAGDDRRVLVDVASVLDSALRLAWNEVRPRATLQRETHATPYVWGHESRLGQALLSLILHVAHGIEEGAPEQNTISVQLYEDACEHVVIMVRDSGRPLSRAARASLLRPLAGTRSSSGALGLALCQRVIAEHGGSISIENGLRNALCVTLPACARAEVELRREERVSEIRALRRGRVLVIDDEQMITKVVRRTLAPEHDVVEVDNAGEALRQLATGERYDAIVCDLMLPGLTGMDFHAQVQRDFPDLADKIVFFTGGAFTARAREFLRSVPNPRVDKPVAGSELRQVINQIVR